jgi:hypothetical protein
MSEPQVRTTTFARLERRGVLLGLSGVQLAVVGIGTTIAVAAVYSAGSTGLLLSAPVWGVLLAAGTVSVAGRPVVGWLPLLASWQVRRLLGSTTKTATTAGVRRSAAQLVVPGIAGHVDLVESTALGGVLLVDRRVGTATGVVSVTGPGFVLADDATQEHRVDAWGRVLASVCQQHAIVRVQLLSRAVPSGLTSARRWWREHIVGTNGPIAAALAGLIDEGFVEPLRREAFIAIAVRLPRVARRGTGIAGVEAQLRAVASALAGADLVPGGWLDRDRLTRMLRAGYEPFAAARYEELPAVPAMPAAQEHWSSLTLGTAEHATYWVSEWPRTATHPGFLQPLLLGGSDVRAFSLIAEPLPTARALREIRRAKVEHAADASARLRIGQVEDEATRAEVADLERREAELVAGHGDLRFTGLLTVSASGEAELEDRCVALETAAAQAICEVRRLVGQQGVAFLAAALPLARGVL